jgi:hypothetical protein
MFNLQGSEQQLEDAAELQNAALRSPGTVLPLLEHGPHSRSWYRTMENGKPQTRLMAP